MNRPLLSMSEGEKRQRKENPAPYPFCLWVLPHFSKVQNQYFSWKQHKALVFPTGVKTLYNMLMRQFSKLQIHSISSPFLYFCCYQDLNGTWNLNFWSIWIQNIFFQLVIWKTFIPSEKFKQYRPALPCVLSSFSYTDFSWVPNIQQLLTLPLRILKTLPMSKSVRDCFCFLFSSTSTYFFWCFLTETVF